MTRKMNSKSANDLLTPSIISKKFLCLVTICGVSYFGLVILILSLLSNDYNPMNHFASDYGVGRFAIEMNLGFLVGGIGFIAFALSIFSNSGRIFTAGSILLAIAGLILGINAFFPTDVEGAPHTLHGIVHALGGGNFFLTAPIGILLTSYRLGKNRFMIILSALATSVIFFVMNTALLLDAGGLAQRIMLLVVFSSIIALSLQIFRSSENQGKDYLEKKINSR